MILMFSRFVLNKYNMEVRIIEKMIGLIPNTIQSTGDEMKFFFTNGEMVRFYHYQDCCENVSIDEIEGSLNDLLNHPLIMAEETWNTGTEDGYDSFTWTFYKFATIKGYVTVKWYGTSNGYYSEGVDIEWNNGQYAE